MHAVHIRAIHAMSSGHSMHLQVMIPLGGRLYVVKGLEDRSSRCNDGCFKSWICETWVDLYELHMPSCIQFPPLNWPQKSHNRSEIVCTLDIFGIHLQHTTSGFVFPCIVPSTPSSSWPPEHLYKCNYHRSKPRGISHPSFTTLFRSPSLPPKFLTLAQARRLSPAY